MGLFDRLRRESASDASALDEDALRPEEITPQGGTWSGLLFDNPSIDLPPALTWTFVFACAEVSRGGEDSAVSLTVAWVPLPGATWSAMAGHSAACEIFAEPIECSAYFFEHSAYQAVRLEILEQEESRLRVTVEAHGDAEGLGIPSWNLDQWLDFDCIYVQLDGIESLAEASESLAQFTDPSGLTPVDNGHNVRFIGPARGSDAPSSLDEVGRGEC